jgi:hypothetical protein
MICLSITRIVKTAALFALFSVSSLTVAAQNADSYKIAELFNQIKEHCALAEDDAQLLESYTRSGAHWQSHARQLAQVKDHVNDLLNDYNEAQLLRNEGSPWQQAAIDQIRPVLKTMADHLTATIEHQRNNPSHVRFRAWIDYVHANREYTAQASNLIHDVVDYGKANETASLVEMKLQLSPSTNLHFSRGVGGE